MKNKMLKTSCTAITELEFNEVTELFVCGFLIIEQVSFLPKKEIWSYNVCI